MPFTEALPPEKSNIGTGISCGLRVGSRGKRTVKIYLNAETQERLFGGAISARAAKVMIGRGPEEGQLRIEFDEQGLFEFKATMKGSVCLSIRGWDLLPGGKRPSVQIEAESHDKNGMTLRLPSWSRPNGSGGKVEENNPTRRAPEPSKDKVGITDLAKAGRMKAQAAALARAAE